MIPSWNLLKHRVNSPVRLPGRILSSDVEFNFGVRGDLGSRGLFWKAAGPAFNTRGAKEGKKLMTTNINYIVPDPDEGRGGGVVRVSE